MPRGRGRSWAGVAGDAALTVAAVLGTVCILLVIAAALFDVRIILFSTGSMSPTIPAGSAALVRSIPAADVQIGDVVTIDRPGQLPITHRVTGVEEIPDASPTARRITMRGDANAVDDPFPYDVTSVRLVVFAVPGTAPVVAAFGNPWVLGALTIGATALVVVVFWPRRSGAPDSDDDDEDGSGEGTQQPLIRGPRQRSGAAVGLALAFAFACVAAASATPAPAEAASDERVVQGRVIRLVSIEEPRMSDMAPGTSAVWLVGISADAPNPGTLTVLLTSDGDGGLGLRYDVQSCVTRWDSGACAESETLVPEQTVPVDGAERDILSMPSDEARWLRIAVARPAGSDPDASGAVEMEVRAVGVGDDVSTSPDRPLLPGLPATGAAAPWVMSVLAVALLATGGVLTWRARRSI